MLVSKIQPFSRQPLMESSMTKEDSLEKVGASALRSSFRCQATSPSPPCQNLFRTCQVCFNTTFMHTVYVHQCPKQIASFVVGLPQTASARTMT